MTDFNESYLGQLRKSVGSRLLLVPGALIVIENPDGDILLQKRSDFGLWGLPGGNAELGEDITTSIIREVLEETGLTITDPVPFGFGSDPKRVAVTFPNGDACQFFVLAFTTRIFSGALQMLDGESLALDWVAPSSLPNMLPNMAASVDAYLKFRETGEFQMF